MDLPTIILIKICDNLSLEELSSFLQTCKSIRQRLIGLPSIAEKIDRKYIRQSLEGRFKDRPNLKLAILKAENPIKILQGNIKTWVILGDRKFVILNYTKNKSYLILISDNIVYRINHWFRIVSYFGPYAQELPYINEIISKGYFQNTNGEFFYLSQSEYLALDFSSLK
jgi:hypothetical protein